MFAIFCNMSSAITVNVVSFPFNYLNYFIIICLCLTYNIIILYTSYFRINKNNKSNYNIDNNKNDAYNKMKITIFIISIFIITILKVAIPIIIIIKNN